MRAVFVKLIIALCLVSFVATGCGKSDEKSSSKDTSLPSGTQWAKDSKAKVRFAIPDDWSVVSPAEAVKNKKVPEAIEKYAKAQGVSAEELLRQFSQQLSLFAIDKVKAGRFTSNVNVQLVAGASMPTQDQLTQQFSGMKVTVGKFVDRKTPLGTAKLLDYDFDLGTTKASGRILAVKTGSDIVLVTLTAADDATAEDVIDDVSGTISKVG